MFYHSSKLQYEVRCEKPNPLFAKMLQQAIGGIEGEIRVAMHCFFQGWAPGPRQVPRSPDGDRDGGAVAHRFLGRVVALNLAALQRPAFEGRSGQGAQPVEIGSDVLGEANPVLRVELRSCHDVRDGPGRAKRSFDDSADRATHRASLRS